jgi:ligand-binding sensor domain-containing protein
MTIILSLSKEHGALWAAGPEGLYRVNEGQLEQVAQPQQNLYCCCAIHDRILVGGLPHGVAFSMQQGENWQAGWMDNVDAPVVTLAADPEVMMSGVVLAGTDGGGILRSINRGSHWFTRNFGLRSFSVLSIAWAPKAPAESWPRWQMVFAGTEEGLYYSPNAGRGWKRTASPEAVYQTVAVGQDYHTSGLVLAGTESDGLFRSVDGGRRFEPVPGAPAQVNSLASTAAGWILSDESQLWSSVDGLQWEPLPGSNAALVLLRTGDEVVAGTENGVQRVETVQAAVAP